MSLLGKVRAQFRELYQHVGFRQRPLRVTFRALRWILHCGFGIPAWVRFDQPRFSLYLPPKLTGGGSTYVFLFRELYDPEFVVLGRLLQRGMVFVDAGANTGAFAFAAAKLVGPEGRVLAFEPGRRCFNALEQSLQINGFGNIVLRREALADRRAMARLYQHRGNENSFSLGAGQQENLPYETIETVSLEQVLSELKLERLDFLKLDVEGAQELALRGCLDLLARWQPIVLIENDQGACRRLHLDPSGAFQLLAGFGYQWYVVDTHGEVSPLADPLEVRTVLALPPTPRDALERLSQPAGTPLAPCRSGGGRL